MNIADIRESSEDFHLLETEVGEERETLRSGQSLIVPAGVKHRFVNDASKTAFAFTVYAPPAYQTDDPT